ncbi:hypothetical protein SAMN04488029_0037 [Reichenbachiella faecimaris]|uniref:Uncharacterized protein n=1 Tax=Reichenbachiella faecimaris TaxID=692418 RepID=A0A1W2G5H0_REIFA|nr:hypothetical protein [Reichenbachiella faecimaris]SMD31692.1 hypothetical protein SAMN04488029_0037 [Reichenbachiella faecimaris]
MKHLKLILTTLLLVFLTAQVSLAQKKNYKSKPQKESTKPKAFHVHQHVMVTMKDGSQVEAVVHSHFSKKKYWVRQWHSGREGAVKEKYIRALSDDEVAELKKGKKK